MADSPSFSIDNSYERNENYSLGNENVTETFDQNYTIGWTERMTDRLFLDFGFALTISDNINSQGIDSKEVTPNLNLGLSNPIWDLTFDAENSISQTNELNVERKDGVNLSAEFNLTPNILPVFSITHDVQTDIQKNLEDSQSEKIDMTTNYTFGKRLSFDASFGAEKFDDRFNDNSDTESSQWDINLTYGLLLTSSLKLDMNTSWGMETSDTLNNAGQILLTEDSETRDMSFQVSFQGYPDLSSTLEISNSREPVADTEETEITVDLETAQYILALGSVSETLEITSTDSKSPDPAEDSLEKTLSLSLGFEGSPSKWIDYSIEESLDYSDSQFQDSSLDTDTKNSDFNISLTSNPSAGWKIDGAFNWAIGWEKGIRTSETMDYKIDTEISGEALNIPNLTFNPAIDYTQDKDLETGQVRTTSSLELNFEYSPDLPPPFTLVLQPNYKLDIPNDGDNSESLEFDYEAGWQLDWGEWSFDLRFDGKYSDTLTDDESEDTSSDLTFQVTSVVFGNVDFDMEYKYKIAKDSDSEASLDFSLDWQFQNMNFSLEANGERTFDADKTTNRTYSASFFMDF